MRINNNMAAMNAWRSLNVNSNNMQKSLEKLSSGYRINRASDDAAGLAVSEKMRAQIRGTNMAVRNAQDGISLVQTAEGATGQVQNMLQRMRELAVQAKSAGLDDDDRKLLNKEFTELKGEIDRTTKGTKFNGQDLLVAKTGKDAVVGNGVATPTGAVVGGVVGAPAAAKDGTISGISAGTPVVGSATAGGTPQFSVTGLPADVLGDGDYTVVHNETDGTVEIHKAGVMVDSASYTDVTGAGELEFVDLGVKLTFAADLTGKTALGTLSLTSPKADVSFTDASDLSKVAATGNYTLELDGDEVVIKEGATEKGRVALTDVTNAGLVEFTDLGITLDFGGKNLSGATDLGSLTSAAAQPAPFSTKADPTSAAGVKAAGTYTVATNGTDVTITNKADSTEVHTLVGAAATGGKIAVATLGIELDFGSYDLTAAGTLGEVTLTKTEAGSFTATPDPTKVDISGDFSVNFDHGSGMVQIIDDATKAVAAEFDHANPPDATKPGKFTFHGVEMDFGNTDFTALTADKDLGKLTLTKNEDAVAANPKLNTYTIQVGADRDNTIDINLAVLDSEELGLNGATPINIGSAAESGRAIDALDGALSIVNEARATMGAVQNRLENAVATLNIQSENLVAAESRIRDVDMAAEMSQFTKHNILQQASTAMLAQANQSTQSILSLLR